MKATCTALLVLLIAVLTSSPSSAEVPQMINYQGRLTDSTGAPLDTTVSMRFRIYADSTTSTYLWTETHSSVTVDEGLFNVLLGSATAIPDSVFGGSVRYLGIKVGSDSEMTPRGKLVSVGYAFHSESADTAEYARVMAADNDWVINGDDIYHQNGNVGIGTTPSYKLHVVSGSGPPIYSKTTEAWGGATAFLGQATETGDYTNYGGYFTAAGQQGRGVYGEATNTGNYINIGGLFIAAGQQGRGVSGYSHGNSGIGVEGAGFGSSCTGVYGLASTYSGTNYGVYGETWSDDGYGGYFLGRSYFNDEVGIGKLNPQRPLHIKADASDYNLRLEENGGNNEYFDIGVDNYGDLNFFNDDGTVALCIEDNSNRIGIGTTNPTGGKIHVLGSGNYCGLYVETSGSGQVANIGLKSATNEWFLQSDETTDSAGSFQIWNTWLGNDALTITKRGRVGIGTRIPGTFRLYVVGSAFSTGNWQGSDLRLKKNVEKLTGVVERLKNINGVKFDWRCDEFPDKGLPEAREIGIIAQDVEKEFPELVSYDNEGYKVLAYDRFVGVLLEAIKDQQKQIEAQQKEIEQLKAQFKIGR